MRVKSSSMLIASLLCLAACADSEPASAPTAPAAPAAVQDPAPTASPVAAQTPDLSIVQTVLARRAASDQAAQGTSTTRTIERATGDAAPDFALTLFDGESLRLSDLRGKVVVLNFWGSWCPPCRAEMPAFQRIWEEYRDKDVVFLGVAVGDRETTARVFAKQTGVTYPLGLDKTGNITVDYQVLSFPTTFVIDREGNEAKRFGVANEGVLRIFLNGQLNDG